MTISFEELVTSANAAAIDEASTTANEILKQLGNRLNILSEDEIQDWFINKVSDSTRRLVAPVGARTLIGVSAGLMNILLGLMREAKNQQVRK